MNITDLWNIILINPIVNILIAFYNGLNFLHFPAAFALSVLILTILVRLALWPLTAAQLKSAKKMADLRPELAKIKTEHGHDKVRHQQEQMKLYKEHGINPAAGCLPVLIQMPIIWALYAMLQKVVSVDPHLIVSEINKLVYIDAFKLISPWDSNFFGLPLGKSPAQLFSTMGILVFMVPVLTGIFQLVLSKMLLNSPNVGVEPKTPQKEKKEDFASSFQTQSLYIFPIMIGFFSYTFSIGLSLYWNTFTVFGIIQQYKILGWGGLSTWIDKIKKPNDK